MGCTNKEIYRASEHGVRTASLEYPNFIEIGSLDGDSIENLFSRIFHEGKREVVFPTGAQAHTVELRYNDIWDIDDDHEKIVSPYITLQFNTKPDHHYKVSVDAPKNRNDAWKSAFHFNAEIIDVRTGMRISGSLTDPPECFFSQPSDFPKDHGGPV